ncbi:MAG: uncharacterized protein KVP18_001802 [Porospora cf. gigantea A]|uniref:uncharacterized protein n=1 Tax=Porospora cf. gigantea A TaxID=2853593 RepID=UPI003559E7F8|nr:MAG: hypothetical protein KVP18_001802 [Porospora cf. gigantea A]
MFPDYDSYSYEETLPDDHRRLRHLDQSGSFRIDGRRHESTHFSHERPVLEEVPLPEYEVIHQDGAAVSAAFRPWMRDQPAESVDSYPPSDNPRSDNPPSDYPRASCTPSSHPSDVECCAPVPRRMPLPTHTMAPDASSSSSEVRRPNFDPAWYARPGLSVEEVEDYKQAFDVFDVQGRGRVDPLELRRTLLSLSQDHRNSTLYMILAEVEKYTKPIGFEDFLNIMTQKVLNASGFTSRQDVSRVGKKSANHADFPPV